MADVRSRHSTQIVRDPHKGDTDAWHDFRQVEVLNLHLTQQYQHSLGKYSRFFIELENKRLFATRCENCKRVYVPPRPLCPNCTVVTQWVELNGTGSVETFSVMHFGSGANADVNNLPTPYVLAYVLLDGASTLFPHILKAEVEQIYSGMRVRIAYNDGPVEHPIHLMHFVPEEAI